MAQSSLNIAIITEGKAGHLSQSRGIAALINREKNLQIIKINLEKGVSESILRILTSLNCRTGTPPISCLWEMAKKYISADDIKRISENPPNLIISTGTIPASFNVILAKKYRCRNIISMYPSIIPVSSFTLAVLPAHDSPPNPPENTISVSTSPNECLPEIIKDDGDIFARENALDNSQKYWALFLGGESKVRKFPSLKVCEIVKAILETARSSDRKCLVTTSRRTPVEFESELKNLKEEFSSSIPFLQIFSENPKSTTKGILALSERVFITEDSVSMVSESLWARKSTCLIELPPQSSSKPDDKINRFKNNLVNKRLITVIRNKESFETLFSDGGFQPAWDSFDDVDKVRGAVNRLM